MPWQLLSIATATELHKAESVHISIILPIRLCRGIDWFRVQARLLLSSSEYPGASQPSAAIVFPRLEESREIMRACGCEIAGPSFLGLLY